MSLMIMIMIINLYSAFFICNVQMRCTHTVSTQMPDHNTGNFVPYSLRIVCGYLTPASRYKTEDTGDGTYGLSSFFEKTRMSNHLQM